jgi:autotransporter-associated beta strand protein
MLSPIFLCCRPLARVFLVAWVLSGCLISVSRGSALTWDFNGVAAPNPGDGSGSWSTANNWWNSGAGVNTNGNWTATNPDSAVFGAGVAGVYTVDLGSSNLYVSNVTFNSSVYTLTNGMITLPVGGSINVATGQTASISATVYGANSGQNWTIATNATLNVRGNVQSMQVMWMGGGTVNLAGTNSPSIFWANTVVNQTGGSVTPGVYSFIGYSGGPGSYTVNGAAASLNVNGGVLTVARGGQSGTLTIQNGTVNVGTTAAQSLNLALDNNNNNTATVNVQGGTLNVGSAGIGSQIQLMPGGGSSLETATLNISGGMVNAQGIQFGSANSYSGGAARLTLTNGSLYIGSLGIVKGVNLPGTTLISLLGGTIGASANWSSAMPMTLGNGNTNVTFQAADAVNNARNITLSGVLAGTGGLTKTGGGVLTLGGANTYTGSTTVNAGTLSLTTASSGAGIFTNNGGILDVQLAGAGASLNMSALTLNAGSQLNLDLNSLGNPTAPIINVSGALTPASPVTINLAGATLSAGQFPLVKYGSMGGAGFGAFTLGSFTPPLGVGTSASLVNNTANQSIDLKVVVSSVPKLIWDGTVNGNWDIGGTANWKTNAYYTETNGTGPEVIFDDTANGSAAVVLSGMVSPLAVVVSNSVQTYSISGPGGIAGGAGLLKTGTGILTLGGNNTYMGGTTINAGTLALATTNNVSMDYAINGGTLKTRVALPGTSLAMSSLTFDNGSPQLTFDFGNLPCSIAPAIDDSGSLTMKSNVTVNVTNLNLSSTGVAVLLRYTGIRSGSGSFVAGTVPGGMTILDDTVNQQVLAFKPGLRVIIPSLNTNETFVALTTPLEYGARADGITDDTVAFQNALNAAGNAGGVGGGVVYVPAGTYAFYNNLTIPMGVTLQGDWTDWASGTNGTMGTIFKVYTGAGQSNGTPFLTLNRSALRGVSIWYPNQNPANITPYPYTISISNDPLVENVALVNSYQGIWAFSAAKHIISTIRGSPLYRGIDVDAHYDISQIQDLRFSPDVWPASGLPGAPAAGGPHAVWMRANGTGMRLERVDGEACMETYINGYNVGVEAHVSTNGGPSVSFYSGSISNCATAFLDGAGGGNTGFEFTRFTLDGDIAFDRSTNIDAAAFFHTCQLIGRNGTAVRQTGGSSSVMQFQDCDFTGTLKLDGGIANLVNCSMTVAPGSNHCVMASGAIIGAFTGCIFNPARTISNAADPRRLIIDGRRASTSLLPIVDWPDIQQDLASRRPARTSLFVVTNAPWNATGNGIADDTAAIQSALNAANTNGGGIVYLPAGKYKLTGTLDVPGGVELRGSYPSRHAAPLYDGHVKVSVLQPYGGAGTTNGPPAVALEANAGIVGLTITYELQNTNATPYPPAIQGRGANIYARGVLCPNAYWFVDLNTYPCTNNFLYQVDGWALRNAFLIGNGSQGSIVESMANLTYWDDNNLSQSQVGVGSTQEAPIQSFSEHNSEWFVLGDCTELLVKDFDYMCHTFMHCVSQNGRGPWITGIETMIDDSVECFRFEAAAPCHIDIVNPEWMVTLEHYPDVTGYGVISTAAFQGTARFFNAPLWGPRPWDYVIQGGDVGFELTHAGYRSTYGTKVDSGVLHLINGGFEGNTASLYTVPFNSASGGLAGKASEIIGCYAWSNVNDSQVNTNNPVFAWGNFAINVLSSQAVFNVIPPVISINPNSSGTAGNVAFNWRADMGAFIPHYATNLNAPIAWMTMTNVPCYASNRWSATDSPADKQRFYRLQP